MEHQKRPDFLAPTQLQHLPLTVLVLAVDELTLGLTDLGILLLSVHHSALWKYAKELLLPNLFNHRRREEHAFTVRANFYTVILLHKDLCMCQITRWPFSPSAALCFSVEVKGEKEKLRRVCIVDSTHQDAYLRIKHKVLFNLTYITIFSKLQCSSYFQILTEECLISLVAWIKRAKKIHTHVLQYVLKCW